MPTAPIAMDAMLKVLLLIRSLKSELYEEEDRRSLNRYFIN
jgi:hypothetical protein